MFGHKRNGLLHRQLQAICDYAAHKPEDLATAHSNLEACEKFALKGLQILEYFEDNFGEIVKKLEKEIEREM